MKPQVVVFCNQATKVCVWNKKQSYRIELHHKFAFNYFYFLKKFCNCTSNNVFIAFWNKNPYFYSLSIKWKKNLRWWTNKQKLLNLFFRAIWSFIQKCRFVREIFPIFVFYLFYISSIYKLGNFTSIITFQHHKSNFCWYKLSEIAARHKIAYFCGWNVCKKDKYHQSILICSKKL